MHGVATTIADLAADLGLDEGDIDVVLEVLGENEPDLHAAKLPDDVSSSDGGCSTRTATHRTGDALLTRERAAALGVGRWAPTRRRRGRPPGAVEPQPRVRDSYPSPCST